MAEITLTATNFDSEISDGVFLVDFWAPWCGPCQAMLPVVAELADELEGRVKVGKINIDEEGELAQKFGVMSIPTFKIFKNGAEVATIVGGMSKENLIAEIEKALV
ncbi:thioredoxin [Candidatus Gracilibacteria bacterium]|nr:thioredoxin [Candidatus Gracilibacteria bacterium]MCF7856526.1 thioredoxin [Candidatus Gracilibacteria bacterium]MCF7896578.1 thioredoxin [Candidatus Gracilibacteria bacterium]